MESKEFMNQGGQGHHKKTNITNKYGLTESEVQTGNLYGINLGPLLSCDSFVACSTCGTLNEDQSSH